ncbi:hypothetical protein B0H10DRAFT_2208949 [Mycena sp. CBHHK59/15]|nr:hypothetical protein B0H10DRAFT_2208931 [Mycena sp. CBHHK59/15]KAJ6629021.1 hypothetical protein B0H10DRAFT_2208949 [Mycena sp. CBHHK59/15]
MAIRRLEEEEEPIELDNRRCIALVNYYQEEMDEIERSKEELDAEELELKREVLTIGPLGPISKAAQAWLSRNVGQVMTLLKTRESEVADLVTKEEIKARVDQLLKIRADGLEREAALKRARQERRRGECGVEAS